MNIYLHHYPASLFSEKIRLMLGYLGQTWHSVEIPSIMPRPLLMPLTGGYRKTPCLQIGANIYCDTAVITEGLVRHTGDETLYAPGFVAHRVAEWADTQLFRVTVALNFSPEAVASAMSQLSPEEVAAFQQDRAQLTGDAPIVTLTPGAARAYLTAYLNQAEASIGDGFLFGPTPSVADFSLYHCLWFVDNNEVNATLLTAYPRVRAWMARMATFGHGEVVASDAESALAYATQNAPQSPAIAPLPEPPFAVGERVSATPVDYGRIAVSGELVGLSATEIVLKRRDETAGEVMTHFPTAGFELARA